MGGSIGDHLGLAAATAVFIALRPGSVLEAGFQMSFAATGRLVALFEARRAQAQRLPTPGPRLAILQATMVSLGAVLLTSLVAGLATDPLVAFHFQRFTVYGLAVNLTAKPIVAFVIAPAATMAALAAPFGLSEGPLNVMRWGLELVLAIGGAFADRPEAILPLPRAPSVALACVTLGTVWMMIWRGPVRWSGACGLAAALALIMAAPRLVVLAWADLRTVLVWIWGDADWRMIARERGSDYTRLRPMELAGRNPQAPAPALPMACQSGKGCGRRTLTDVVMEHPPRGWSRHDPAPPSPAPSDAAQCTVVVSSVDPEPAPSLSCLRAAVIASDGRGGFAAFDTPAGLRLSRGRPLQYDRPWARGVHG